MKGPAGVLGLVLAETATGAALLLFLSPLWNEVKRGFFKVSGMLVALFALAAWASVGAAREPAGAGALAWWLLAAFTAASALWVILLFGRAATAARVVGVATAPLAVAVLLALGRTGEGSRVASSLELLAGAAFMGAVLDGLLLGHWYLTDRSLSRRPINRLAAALVGAVGLEAAAVVAAGFGPTAGQQSINPLLTVAGLASWVALGMVLTTAFVAVMILVTLRGKRATAVQAATGFFYLAVITAFAGELAAKVRFLG